MFIVNVEGAIYKDGKWLLIVRSEKEEHAGGMLSLVGGKVDLEGFSSNILERTLEREVFEEVGVKVGHFRYVNSSSFVTDMGNHVVDVVFLCDLIEGVASPKDPDEVAEVVWMTTEEIVSNRFIPDYLKDAIQLADQLVVKELT